MENHQTINGYIHCYCNWPSSIAMSNYQRAVEWDLVLIVGWKVNDHISGIFRRCAKIGRRNKNSYIIDLDQNGDLIPQLYIICYQLLIYHLPTTQWPIKSWSPLGLAQATQLQFCAVFPRRSSTFQDFVATYIHLLYRSNCNSNDLYMLLWCIMHVTLCRVVWCRCSLQCKCRCIM